jgi:hypothetical protein
MANVDRLIQASVYLSGPYLNEVGREVTYTHEVIAGRRVTRLLHDFNLVIRSLQQQEMLARGPRAVQVAGIDRMDELDVTPDFVADVALSQLHPKWVLDSRPGRVHNAAQLLFTSRAIAQTFHETELALEQAR